MARSLQRLRHPTSESPSEGDRQTTLTIVQGSVRIALLWDPAVFALTALGLYGGSVTWDGDEGDLAIDSEHLRMIADHQVPFAAAEVAAATL